MRFLSTVAAAAGLLSTSVLALEPITIKGNAFFAGDERFYVRGVDYQPGGPSKLNDPLSNTKLCKRDIPKFKELGLNAVRIYTVDNSKDHDECMKLLEEAGIYLILDVNTPQLSLNRDFPKETYNSIYLQHVFATIDVFAKYDNVLGFFAANEVINMKNYTTPAPYIKAIIRDMRAYMKARGHRQVPVGYSAADVAENRLELADYLNCGDDDERADFFAFNDYSWCGGTKSSFTISGYDQKVKDFSHYSIPLFFSEFGCNVPRPREFTEISAMYSKPMTTVFSGGLAYEYTEEENNYGIVDVEGEKVDGKVITGEEFDNLKAMFAKYPAPKDDGGYKTTNKPSKCPPKGEYWEADNTVPEMPSSASSFFEDGAGKPKGTAHTNMNNLPKPGSNNNNNNNDDQDDGDSANDDSNDDNQDSGASGRSGMLMLSAFVASFVGGAMLLL